MAISRDQKRMVYALHLKQIIQAKQVQVQGISGM
jgi:hypothetical protein